MLVTLAQSFLPHTEFPSAIFVFIPGKFASGMLYMPTAQSKADAKSFLFSSYDTIAYAHSGNKAIKFNSLV
jgi:hypothetical protein